MAQREHSRAELRRKLLPHAVEACAASRSEASLSDPGQDDDSVDPGLVACNAPADCGGGETCVQNEQGDGLCMTACRLYDDSGCGAGETCVMGAAFAAADTMVTYCRTFGTAATWESCSDAAPCAPNNSCFSGTCVPHCDDAHACADSLMTCTPPTNYPLANPTNAGACQ